MKSRKLTVEDFLQFGGRSIRSKRSSLEMGRSEGLTTVVHTAGRGVEYFRFTCPSQCGRNCRHLYFRFNRWGCRRCQQMVHRSAQQAHRRQRALQRFEQGGCNPMLMPEWVLILLAGTPD